MLPRWNSECAKCLADKYLFAYPETATEQERLDYFNRVCSILSSVKEGESAPVITYYILKLQEEMFHMSVDYTDIKRKFNQLMLDQEDRISSAIQASACPLKKAIQYVMTGNYIDFGIFSDVDSRKLLELISGVDSQEINEAVFNELYADLKTAKNLVYLTDNCGEVVLDKLLIQTILAEFPDLHVEIIVRGAPAINDATMEDAVQTGLTEIAHVTGNGNAIGGTYLPAVSEEASRLIHDADVLIAKGQGNFETLRGCGLNIYYIFLCKCLVFTKRFSKNAYEGILTNEKYC